MYNETATLKEARVVNRLTYEGREYVTVVFPCGSVATVMEDSVESYSKTLQNEKLNDYKKRLLEASEELDVKQISNILEELEIGLFNLQFENEKFTPTLIGKPSPHLQCVVKVEIDGLYWTYLVPPWDNRSKDGPEIDVNRVTRHCLIMNVVIPWYGGSCPLPLDRAFRGDVYREDKPDMIHVNLKKDVNWGEEFDFVIRNVY